MVTLRFILTRLNLVWTLLPLLSVKRVANLIRAIFHFLTRSQTSVKHPPIIILTLTTDCNYSCIMCLRSSDEESDKGKLMDYKNPREMDFEILKDLLTEHAEYLCMVRLHGGEPLHYSHIRRLVGLLNDLKIPYNMVTNGSLLTPELCTELAGRHCFNIGISLDAATPETYAAIRQEGDLSVVLSNIETLNQMKKDRRSRRPALSASMCTFSLNAGEMADLVHLCKKYQIPSLTVNEGWDYDTEKIRNEHLVANNVELVHHQIAKAKQEAKKLRINLRVRFPSLTDFDFGDIPKQVPQVIPRDCLNLYASAWFLPNFELIGCSNATGGFGNINENNFSDIWNGPDWGYVRSRKCLKSGEVPEECRGCIYTGSFIS